MTGQLGEESFLSQLKQATREMIDNFQARTARELRLQERPERRSLAMVRVLVRRTLKVRK